MTLCPAGLLNAALSERTSAGLCLSACRSENGKGTRTTSKRSKLAIRLLVLGRVPFAQRALDGLQILHVQRLNAPHGDSAVGIDFPGEQISRLAFERSANFLRDGCLSLGGDLGDGSHGKDSLRITSLP